MIPINEVIPENLYSQDDALFLLGQRFHQARGKRASLRGVPVRGSSITAFTENAIGLRAGNSLNGWRNGLVAELIRPPIPLTRKVLRRPPCFGTIDSADSESTRRSMKGGNAV